jgi:hypothetical protein
MIPEKYRSIILHMRGVTSDANGEDVLVGLTAAETAEFFHHVENPDPANQEATDRYLELHERYAAARLDGESRSKSLRRSPGALPWEMPSDQPSAQRPDAENSNKECPAGSHRTEP